MEKTKKIAQVLIEFSNRLLDCKGSCILVSTLLGTTENEIRQIIKQEQCTYCRGTGQVEYSLKRGRVVEPCPKCRKDNKRSIK